MKKIILVLSLVLITFAPALARELRVNQSVLSDYTAAIESEVAEKLAIGEPLRTRARKERVRDLSTKFISKAEKKLLGTYLLTEESGFQLLIDIFDMETFVPGLLSFGYDVFVVNSQTSEGILLYENMTGTATIVKKSAIMSFEVPIGGFSATYSIPLDKKAKGELGLGVVSRVLDCRGSSPNLTCRSLSGQILDSSLRFSLIRLD